MGNPENFIDRISYCLTTENITAPISAEIDLTNKCNQNCYYCNASEYRRDFPDRATAYDYLKLIDHLSDYNNHGQTRSVIFSGGGDPLCSPFATLVISYAVKKIGRVGLVTNGVNLKSIQGMEYVPTWIGIDCDSADPDTYKKIRRGNLFEVITNIKHILPEFKERGTRFTMKYLVTEYNNNYEHISAAIIMARNLGFDEFFLRIAWLGDEEVIVPLVSGTHHVSALSDVTDIKNEYLQNSKRLDFFVKDECHKAGIKPIVNYRKHFHYMLNKGAGPQTVHRCFAPLFLPVFGSDGSVWFCCEYRGNLDLQIGDWISKVNDPTNENLINGDVFKRMMKFDYPCNRMCRYHLYNETTERFINGDFGDYDFF
jgi:MoaA/NifB/PqqE/SkfB family radical SAM enzyme